MAKASGFFHKLRPQLNVDVASSSGRKFSFEVGDDSTAISLPVAVQVSNTRNDRVLRKSSSLPALAEMAQRTTERTLSPVAQSPTTSPPLSESRRASQIPTPVYSPMCVARRRREREDSASSLLTTAIKSSESTRRSDSASDSSQTSPSASRVDLAQRPQSSERASSGKSNRLLSHTDLLRGNVFAAAATRTASTKPHKDSSLTISSSPHMSEAIKENIRPMKYPGYLEDEEGYASP